MTIVEALKLSGGGLVVYSILCTIACIWCRNEIRLLAKGESELGSKLLKLMRVLKRGRLPIFIIGVVLLIIGSVL